MQLTNKRVFTTKIRNILPNLTFLQLTRNHIMKDIKIEKKLLKTKNSFNYKKLLFRRIYFSVL